ncbi:polycystin-1 isoform X2 [Alosa pseudoharengus]|uniref:polycystin-1 isoform X2 n=1 Tax=Alosa pseudoharengus TaxID=34774 RepID=UPI003F8AE416
MPYRNGQTVSKRKHGVYFSKFGFFSSLLFSLCCLEAWSSLGMCSPCPRNCSCTVVGPQNSSVVNCSNKGLDWGPLASELPSDIKILDLSRNRIQSLHDSLFDHLTSLKELDLSNNQITTIDERICDHLFNLTAIDLSFNPLVCDCSLYRLVSWLQERGVSVRRPNSMLCDQPPRVKNQPLLNVSLLTCGLNYAGCLQDGQHTGSSELVIFSYSTPGNFSREECNTLCFHEDKRYGGLGAHRECLCSTNSEPNLLSESQCSAACTDAQVMKKCGWTVAPDVFQVGLNASLFLPRACVHSEAVLSVSSSVLSASYSWLFGDLSPRVITSTPNSTVRHKYALPGRYTVEAGITAGKTKVTQKGLVDVALPPRLELRCPGTLVANHSLTTTLVNWGGVGVSADWRIVKDDEEVARASPFCPPEAVRHDESSRCFQLVATESTWPAARQQCVSWGGELAVVHSQSIRHLLASRVTQERGVWLGLSDVDDGDSLRWVDGSEVASGEEGSLDRGTILRGNKCVSLEHTGILSQHRCSALRAFFCQFTKFVGIPDASVFMVGTAVFNIHRPLSSVTEAQALDMPSKSVEWLLFPALSFTHTARLTSLELITQQLSSDAQVRFQVYRPQCQELGKHLLLPGCGQLCAPMALCQDVDQMANGTVRAAPPCPSLQQWCPFLERCQPLTSSCHHTSCFNCSGVDPLPPGTRRPEYSHVGEDVLFTLPAGPSAHRLVQEGVENLLVFPGDFIALQHDAGPGALLHCTPDPSSPWRQSVLTLNLSDWTTNSSIMATDPVHWIHDSTCLLRVLHVGENQTNLTDPQFTAGLAQPGDYSLEVTSHDPDFPVTASCLLHVVPPLGLSVIHPTNQNGTVYFRPNQTALLLRVHSQHRAAVRWQGSNTTVHFEPFCPQELVAKVAECRQVDPNNETWFAWVDLHLDESPGPVAVELTAKSEVTTDSLTIQARVELPLCGLQIQPHPSQRVLMLSVVSYVAMVEGGTDPNFKWTVDDKPYFTYYNTVFNVIYQNAAIYKLTVTAMNHVSSLTEHFNVTVDRMNPMSEITVLGVPSIVPQGSNLSLAAFVTVDTSVDATFRWAFGDGGYQDHHKLPYDQLHEASDPTIKQFKLQDNVTYVYAQPGEYTLLVSVSNRYEPPKTQKIDVYVFSILTNVKIETEPNVLQAGQSAEFEAHSLPSTYGIVYTWDFGDNSTRLQGRERRVIHTYTHSGIYDVCVTVNNTISTTGTCTKMMVFEEIKGLTVQSSGPTELHTSVEITAQLLAGNNVTWSFDMGDGNVLPSEKATVEHTYIKDGNYSVNITAKNAVSSQWQVIPVNVFVLQVLWLEPAGCIQENTNVSFRAFVSGNASTYHYQWSFGDNTHNETVFGFPTITHSFLESKKYTLSLVLLSAVNRASFHAWVCVQPAVSSVSLKPLNRHIRLGEETKFRAVAIPEFAYTYHWEFGTSDSRGPIQGGAEMTFTYKNPGQYQVMVMVLNNISCSNDTVEIEVQKPVGSLLILHNGTKDNNLTLDQDYTFEAYSDSTDVQYTWNFGDGNIFSGSKATHSYNLSGLFNITLLGQNAVSRNKTVLLMSVLTPMLGLSVNASAVNVPLNASVNFEAHLQQGDQVRYSWILCDRCTSIPGTSTMFYTFRSVGTFNVIVTAVNDIGTAQASILIFVQRELEGLQIIAEELEDKCCYATNQLLHLHASLREGTNMSFSWNILKEQETTPPLNYTGKTIDLNFSTPGTRDIFLIATNLLGQLSVNKSIKFLDHVGELFLDISPNPVALNATVNMSVSVSGGTDLHYNWIADGDLDWFDSLVHHRFESPGMKQVTVEVSNEVSTKTVSKWISVQEPISGVRINASNVTEQNFVASGVNVTFRGDVKKGTNISWTWLLPSSKRTGRPVTSYIFPEPGNFSVMLNATNDISGEALSRDFIVQNRIQGLNLKTSKVIAAVGENVEFTISIASGSSVNFLLSISGDASVELLNMTYVHQFTRVDPYIVNLTAFNQVSSDRKSLHVEVMEPVKHLSIVNCCEAAIPVGVAKTFIANIEAGKPVTYLWTFDLHYTANQKTFWSKEATFTPPEPGTLTIFLRVFNLLDPSGLNISKTVQVQNILTSATLEAQPQDTFINKVVSFRVAVSPRNTRANYTWDFGDGKENLSMTPSHSHTYSRPGQYLVRVNASNLVSWVLTEVEVNIRVLACEEPEVHIKQAPYLGIWRHKTTLVEASVDLKGCDHYRVEYLWEVMATQDCSDDEDMKAPTKMLLPPEVDVQRIQLSVPKMALPAGNYTLVFSLAYEGVPLRKAACLQLSVKAGKLVPIIEGGTYRVWSKTQDLLLSGEQSRDPNVDLENPSLLIYHWDCESTSKGPSHCPALDYGSSGPVLGIAGSDLEVDVEYTFRLTVSKEGMPSESTVQKVLVQSGRIPMVSLECVSCKAQSIFEVSQSSKVDLAGTCSNCGLSHRGHWTARTQSNERLALDSSTTTTGSEGMRLVLRQGILRDGESYVFTLHVADDDMDRKGVASIELQPNLPPSGGSCSLWADGPGPYVRTLLDKVYFNCTGYADQGESPSSLLYSLLLLRCSDSLCEEFCVYKGSSPEHSTFLPPGFSATHHLVSATIIVEDHQGASIVSLNNTLKVVLPEAPTGYSSLPHWLSYLTETTLRDLLKQGDSQRVRELSLALITVLNEYEQTSPTMQVTRAERQHRLSVRGNITRALTALDLTTVNDIQQTSAALAQCTAMNREFVCEECQNSTLDKLESMLEILQTDTKQGTVTPTEIADNILSIMGDLIHQVSQAAVVGMALEPDDRLLEDQHPVLDEPHPLRVAAKAYTLSSELMRIMMHSRVLNEEPLILRGDEIAAAGKRADPQSLLCYGSSDPSPECRRFSIPRTFNTSLSRAAASGDSSGGGGGLGASTGGSPPGVVQLLFQVEPNPFPFNYVANYSVSTEVASMEFRTENGTQIPIANLDESQAITVAVNNGSTPGVDGTGPVERLRPAGSFNVSHCSHVMVRVDTGNTNRQAGLFVQLNFTILEEDTEEREADPAIVAYLNSSHWPNEYNCSDKKSIHLSMTQGQELDHRPYTFFLSPLSHDTTQVYYINVTTGCGPSYPRLIRLEVGVFSSLCQYFSESAKLWRTDGMVPLAETNASRAVCSTRHLTAFAASLFVPPNAVEFIPPKESGGGLVVVLCCVLGLLCYAVAAALLHKLDQLELRRAAVVPFCGKDGLFKYEVQVKTGWSRAAGTTAHVGISLYGRESRSGHRHLDSSGAFTRNSLDIFHIATDASLGNVWKIRVWHDNKGLSPAWLLQYVLVKDLQTGNTYFFLVEEWLSVDNEKTDGRVEIEVEASEERVLRRWPRLLSWELQRALCESHIWVSLLERPRRSPFSGLHRSTCGALLLSLMLLANAVWYTTVAHRQNSSTAVANLVSLNAETLGVGLVTCLVVYPLYLLVFCLLRMSRSKVLVEQLPPQSDQESLEIDDFLDNSMTGSSFLIFNGMSEETCSEETNIDLPTPSTQSLQRWSDCPDVMSESSVMACAGLPPRLKRGQGSRHLGVDITFNPEDEEAAGGYPQYFSSSDEDLIKRILADGQLQVSQLCDPQQLFSAADSDMADLSSIFGDKTEVILLQKLNEPPPLGAVRRDPPKTAFTNHTVVTDVCRPRRFPPWVGQAALWGSWLALVLSSSLSMWLGRSMSEPVALMWLISCMASFVSSFCLLEPLKMVCEGLYFALVVRRVRAEEQDVLVEWPRVERVSQRIPRVRPPQGFALSQARDEARKVRLLHRMLKGFVVYMLFLLVVLLLNYADSSTDTQRLQLRSQLQHRLHTVHFNNINSREDVWPWLADSLLPQLLDGPALMSATGSVLLGPPRLRQLRSPAGCPASDSFPGASWFGCGVRGHALGWSGPGSSLSPNWTLSSTESNGAWHWGQAKVYGSSGFVQELTTNMDISRALIQHLSTHQWLDPLTRALFVEFSLYNTNTNLLAVLTFLLEFPVSERVQSSLDLKTCRLHRLSQGLDLPLLLTMVLLSLVLFFCVREGSCVLREGRRYLVRVWNLAGVCSLALALCVAALHLARAAHADRQWDAFLGQRHRFTDFYGLAQQSQAMSTLSALLLFLLVLKASHQLRFLREWAVFGRALRRSLHELLAASVALLLLLLAYAHTGHLLFHSVLEGYGSVGSVFLALLGSGGRGLVSWQPWSPLACSGWTVLFHCSFVVLKLALLWLVTSALLRNYRCAREELYRPAVDLQDYEMVELFLRRLKIWMGLSRTKEFRHKVRFEGMELPPSRSSSTSDCKSLCLPPLDTPEGPPSPDSVDGSSEASWRPMSWSPCSLAEAPGQSVVLGAVVGGHSWKERAEMEATLRRLLPTFDALLQQLDRVTLATEDLYRAECRLERLQRRSRSRARKVSQGRRSATRRTASRAEDSAAPRKQPHATGPHKGSGQKAQWTEASRSSHPDPGSTVISQAPKASPNPLPPPAAAPTPGPGACGPGSTPPAIPRALDWDTSSDRDGRTPSSLFRHPAHTTIVPMRKRKNKPPPLKNKVHPNPDRPVSGHPKP